MKVDLFDFELPKELIALRPVANRDGARFLVVQSKVIQDTVVSTLPDYINAGDVLVFNDTRVIPARLTGKRFLSNGVSAKIEVTLHMNMQVAADTIEKD